MPQGGLRAALAMLAYLTPLVKRENAAVGVIDEKL
jgi:hypothetical protein